MSTTEEIDLAKLAERVKRRIGIEPTTFRKAGSGIVGDAWLVRLNLAAAPSVDAIRSTGPKTYLEHLTLAETDLCPDCDGVAATCRIAARFAARRGTSKLQWCPKCFGRYKGNQTTTGEDGTAVLTFRYGDSEPFREMRPDGRGYFVARCDCAAAKYQYGKKMTVATANTELCAVRRWFVEQAMIDSARARWWREAQTAHA